MSPHVLSTLPEKYHADYASLQILRKIRFLKIYKTNIGYLVVAGFIKSAFVVNDNLTPILSFLSNHTIAKNAGIKGKVINFLLMKILILSVRIPVIILPKINSRFNCQILIWRGGFRTRLIDLNSNSFLDVAEGKESQELGREIKAREVFSPFINIPEILSQDVNNKFIEQKLIDTCSLQNCRNNELLMNTLELLFKDLERLYEFTSKNVCTSDYIDKRLMSIKNSAHITPEQYFYIDKILSKIKQHLPDTIDIVSSHGDLHLGNILAVKDNYYLLDWERTDQRSYSHDYFNLITFCNYIHSGRKNLVTNIEKLVSNTILGDAKEAGRMAHYNLYFLERVSMHCDYSLPNSKWLNILMRIIREENER
ncbi:MAG: hypothetical protein GKR93_08555 [Gammaproteobacteria bacterium]|nr:hypothetical protein [Gammaproteobacteria bacterium]